MNVFKRLLNVITIGILVYSVLAAIYIYKNHGNKSYFFPDSENTYLSEKHGLYDEYDEAWLQLLELQISNDFRKVVKTIGGVLKSQSDYDDFINEHLDDEFKTKYNNAKKTYEDILTKVHQLEKIERNKNLTKDRITTNVIFIFLGLFLIAVINYILFGKIQLIHRFK